MLGFFHEDVFNAQAVCDRRKLLTGAAAAAVVVLPAIDAAAQQADGASRLHAAAPATSPPPPASPPRKATVADLPGNRNRYPDLLSITKICAAKGEVCVKQCVAGLNQGDTTLVDCLKATTAMLPICRALARYASIEARYMADLLKLALAVNEDCEKECRKHAAHNVALKECAEACKACIAECQKVLESLA